MHPQYTATDVAQFWAHLDRSGSCWLWTGSAGTHGYGVLAVNGRQHLTHRISWELHHGTIPAGLYVLHNCPGGDTRRCVNPAHLWLGTAADNVQDMFAKGRGRPGRTPGERNWNAKLSTAQVLEIRARYMPRKVTLTQLAHEYGVDPSQIQHIVRGRQWQHVGGPFLPSSFRGPRLTEDVVRQIRTAHALGASYEAVGRIYNVTAVTVSRIVRRLTWAHVL